MHRLVLVALLLACSEERERPARPAPRPVEPAAAPPTPASLPESREVRFTSGDGITLVGDLQPAERPDAPLVVLVHQLASDRSEWAALRARLHAAPGIATFAFDLRGHGQSTAGPSGPIDFHRFTPTEWAATGGDVLAAVRELTSERHGLSPRRIAAVGSSIGSTAVIVAAAEDPRIEIVVALSPGRAYHGFDALTPITALSGRPFFAVVARDETENVETAQAMARVLGGEALLVEGGAHGVALFGADPTSLDRVEAFLRGALGAERP
jgi:pimeloyl-ACP methyl ester carboxylesterase